LIAIIEDDAGIRELICYTLNNTGFQTQGFPEGNSFFEFMKNEIPELLLLDVMLPNEDGISILKKLRADAKTKKMPIIMLTAKDSEYDKIIGLDNGADDYVTKPFGMMELVSRIKAVLRRIEQVKTEEKVQVYEYKNLVMKHMAHMVLSDGIQVELTLKEYKMLQILLQNKGFVMSRDMLLDKIWGYAFDGETRTVDVHIRSLRAKLGVCGDYIETIRGVGYKIGGAM
jgi:Response regulators consisting of a CheY-like receiver domain and a winged-helix DNA-binding domain